MECDGKKPQCMTCVRSGRQCVRHVPGKSLPDAASSSLPQAEKKAMASGPVTTPSLIPEMHSSPGYTFDLQESRYFQSFLDLTTRGIFGHTDSQFWIRTVLEERHFDAPIRHAVLALGGLYEETLGREPTIHHNFAKQQYVKALATTVSSGSPGPRANRNVLMGSVLLVCFECFLGDHKSAIRQLQYGLHILYKSRQKHDVDDEIVQIFTRLAIQMKSCGEAIHFPQPCALHISTYGPALHPATEISTSDECLEPLVNIQMPVMFETTQQSGRTLEALHLRILHFNELVASYPARFPGFLAAAERSTLQGFRIKLSAWAAAFRTLLESRLDPGLPSSERVERSILKMNSLTMALLLNTHFAGSEVEFDIFSTEFREIVDLAKEVIDEERLIAQDTRDNVEKQKMPQSTPGLAVPTSPIGEADIKLEPKVSFTAGLGIIFPLYTVATKYRDQQVRRHAIRLLNLTSRRELIWESSMCARIAGWVVHIEEECLSGWEEVPECVRVEVKEVDFDLKARKATCWCGTRGLRKGEPDERAREARLEW